jgi:hypothetical protein
MKYCPISAADYDQGFQWIDLSDDCQELLDPYCQPDPDSASPTSTTFPTFCIPGNASATTTTEPLTPTATVPLPTMPGTMSDCTKYHLVTSDDSCQALADDYNISISDVHFLSFAILHFHSKFANIVALANILELGGWRRLPHAQNRILCLRGASCVFHHPYGFALHYARSCYTVSHNGRHNIQLQQLPHCCFR